MSASTTVSTPSETSDAENPKRSIWVRLWPLYLIAAVLGTAWYFGVFDLFSLETLREQREALSTFVSERPVIAYGAYLALYVAVTAFMIPGALWVTIAGGFLFGLIGGSIATVIGATLGATLLFFAAKTSIGSVLRRIAGPFARRLEGEFKENQVSYMFAMRFVPAMPFNVANIVPAVLGAKLHWYMLTTLLGIIPGVVAYTWVGAGLGETFAAGEDPNLGEVFWNLFPAGIALVIVSLIPVAYKKFAGRKASKLQAGADAEPAQTTDEGHHQ